MLVRREKFVRRPSDGRPTAVGRLSDVRPTAVGRTEKFWKAGKKKLAPKKKIAQKKSEKKTISLFSADFGGARLGLTSKSDSSRFFALDGQFFRSLRSLEPILCFRDTIQSFFFLLCLPDITISLIYIGIPSDVSGCFLIGFYIRINFLQPPP